jgi:hypothetical protein
MINITADPQNPNKLVLTQTVTLYLDKLLTDILSEEVAIAIQTQAKKDLLHNKQIKKAISAAAFQLLKERLGVVDIPTPPPMPQENL